MKQKKSIKVLIIGLVCITALELFALYQGIDGKILSAVIATIAFILGIRIKTPEFIK